METNVVASKFSPQEDATYKVVWKVIETNAVEDKFLRERGVNPKEMLNVNSCAIGDPRSMTDDDILKWDHSKIPKSCRSVYDGFDKVEELKQIPLSNKEIRNCVIANVDDINKGTLCVPINLQFTPVETLITRQSSLYKYKNNRRTLIDRREYWKPQEIIWMRRSLVLS